MDIYILQDGVRRGPFRVFQIKEMVDRGEAAPGDLGWHQGLETWRPLAEIQALSPYLQPVGTKPPALPEGYFEEAKSAPAAPARQRARFPWRRLFARLVDAWLLRTVLGGICLVTGVISPGEYLVPWNILSVSFIILWAVIEAFMLSRWACSPGKWFFGLRVAKPDGAKLSFGEATTRAFQAWFLGWALGLFPLNAITGVMWLVFYRRHRRAWWDVPRNFDVQYENLRASRLVLLLTCFVAQTTLNAYLLLNYPLPDYVPAPLREMVDRQNSRMQEQWNKSQLPSPD
ncbi:MAG: RDD family protein [Verrucomicrobiales bacterium]